MEWIANGLTNWILTRLTQPSTWRGIVLIATACGVSISPDRMEAIVSAGLGIVGLINVIRDERKAAKATAAHVATAVATDVTNRTLEDNGLTPFENAANEVRNK